MRSLATGRTDSPRIALVHEHLLRAMAAGDESAFASLYEQTVTRMYTIARSMLRCEEDAEEVVCDVYTIAWQRASSYDSAKGSVMAWLAIMVRNRSVDLLRQRRDNVSLDDERHAALALSLTGMALGPEQLMAQHELGSTVHRALTCLTPERRRLLRMAFFDGLTHREIAEAVGMPLGTVKSHVRRALAMLQGAVE